MKFKENFQVLLYELFLRRLLLLSDRFYTSIVRALTSTNALFSFDIRYSLFDIRYFFLRSSREKS